MTKARKPAKAGSPTPTTIQRLRGNGSKDKQERQ